MKKARVIYQAEAGENKEGYNVELFEDGEWGLCSFYPLVRRENAKKGEERNFVHFGILRKINELAELGYSIKFM